MDPGPKSTPTFADDRLFTLGMSGIVTAFDAATGRQLWQKPAPPVEPLYHTAMSPLVDGNLVDRARRRARQRRADRIRRGDRRAFDGAGTATVPRTASPTRSSICRARVRS